MRKFLFLFAIIGFGLFVRYWNASEWYLFDYDQEVVAWAVKQILVDGKLTLIGQEMSVGGFYLGPLLYYFYIPFFLLFRGDPFFGIAPLFLQSLGTMTLLYILGKQWFDHRTGLIAVFLYAINPLVIRYDLGFNPTAYVSFMSILFLLAMNATLAGKKYGLWFLAGVLGLTFHINPSLLFLFPLTGIVLFSFRRRIRVSICDWIIGGGIILLFLFPLILFELRHGILLPNMALLLTEQVERVVGLGRFFSMSAISLSLARGFFFRDKHTVMSIVIGMFLALSLGIWIRKRGFSPEILLGILFFFIPISLFTFYNGHVPEYYFQPMIPIFALWLALLLRVTFRKNFALIIVCTALVIMRAPDLYRYVVGGTHRSLPYRRAAVQEVIRHTAGRPFSVSYITDPGFQSGYPYLFYAEGHEPRDDFKQPIYTLIDPYFAVDPNTEFDAVYGNVGVKYPE